MSFEFSRRTLVATALGGAGTLFALGYTPFASASSTKKFEVTKTDAQWKRQLTDMQYYILRQEGTERAFSHPSHDDHRKGVYLCAGCDLPVFSSRTKFDSGTGWPSFFQPLKNAVGTSTDYKIGIPRTEVHCRRCGGHLGHVFNDGPPPTGKRYCMNGYAMKFQPV